MAQVHEEFDVSLLTGDRRRIRAEPRQSYRSRRMRDLFENPLADPRVPDDALADLVTAGFELGLDERYHVGLRAQQRGQNRQDLSQGNERDVDADEIDRSWQITGGQMACVEVLDDDHARVSSPSTDWRRPGISIASCRG